MSIFRTLFGWLVPKPPEVDPDVEAKLNDWYDIRERLYYKFHVGHTFSYLGVTMVVAIHYLPVRGAWCSLESPMTARYVDNTGVVHDIRFDESQMLVMEQQQLP